MRPKVTIEQLIQAKKIIRQENKASATLLQGLMNLSFAQAAEIIFKLEDEGYIGPQMGARPRKIFLK